MTLSVAPCTKHRCAWDRGSFNRKRRIAADEFYEAAASGPDGWRRAHYVARSTRLVQAGPPTAERAQTEDRGRRVVVVDDGRVEKCANRSVNPAA
jgi:hypothetical protein